MNPTAADCYRRFVFSLCLLLFIPLIRPTGDATGSGETDSGQLGLRKNPGSTATAPRGNKERKMADTDKISEEEGTFLLKVARQTIEQELFSRKDPDPSRGEEPSKFLERRGTFVTLTIQGRLRGCIGHIIPQESLIEGVRVNAINAAFRDPRFRPLTKEEWKRVKIEVSILTDPKPLSYTDADDLLKKLQIGTDGVIIKKGYHQATFLPQVWEQLPGKAEFLTHLCMKAGLDGEAWRKGDLEVSTYQVQAFEE
jgi:AmmeMemoRadiSam system protein A